MIPQLHSWVSRRALRRAGFSGAMIAVVGETSRWTDWYRWTDNIANASTPSDSRGWPIDPDGAARTCSAILHDYLNRIQSSPPNEQLVWLGMALHIVQDLAAHQGRTDPEHVMQTFLIVPNPDWNLFAVRRGLGYCERLLETVRNRLGPHWGELQQGDGARLLTDPEAERLLGPKDYSFPALFQTLSACRLYFRVPRAQRQVRWNCEQVLSQGLAR